MGKLIIMECMKGHFTRGGWATLRHIYSARVAQWRLLQSGQSFTVEVRGMFHRRSCCSIISYYATIFFAVYVLSCLCCETRHSYPISSSTFPVVLRLNTLHPKQPAQRASRIHNTPGPRQQHCQTPHQASKTRHELHWISGGCNGGSQRALCASSTVILLRDQRTIEHGDSERAAG